MNNAEELLTLFCIVGGLCYVARSLYRRYRARQARLNRRCGKCYRPISQTSAYGWCADCLVADVAVRTRQRESEVWNLYDEAEALDFDPVDAILMNLKGHDANELMRAMENDHFEQIRRQLETETRSR